MNWYTHVCEVNWYTHVMAVLSLLAAGYLFVRTRRLRRTILEVEELRKKLRTNTENIIASIRKCSCGAVTLTHIGPAAAVVEAGRFHTTTNCGKI